MRIWQRVLVPPAIALACLVGAGVANEQVQSSTRKDLRELAASQVATTRAAASHALLGEAHADAYRLFSWLANLDDDKQKARLGEIQARIAKATTGFESLSDAPGLAPAQRAALPEMLKDLRAYAKTVDSSIDMAAIDANTGLASMQNADRAFARMQERVAKFVDRQNEDLAAHEAAVESALSRQRVVTWTLTAVGVLATLVAGLLVGRVLRRRLGAVMTRAEEVLAGRLDQSPRLGGDDEVAALADAFDAVRERVRRLVADQTALAEAHARGATDHRIDASAYPGAYAELVAKMHGLVDAEQRTMDQFRRAVVAYARGDFRENMSRLPGRKGEIHEAADAVRDALQTLPSEVSRIASAAARGDFGERADLSRYEGDFRAMMAALNDVMALSQRSLEDNQRLFRALAEGDLGERIEGDYPGAFAELKRNANASMARLAALVAEIRSASEAISTAASEMATGNADLSSRTETQAASLQETSSTMEELTATVRRNASNAREAEAW